MRTALIHWLSVACLCSTPAMVALAGDQFKSSRGTSLSLNQAIGLALEHNPSLVIAGHQLDIQEAIALQAGLSPNPELRLSAENIAGSGHFSGVDSAETTISLGWVLERGKRAKRTAASRAGISLAETARDIRRLDVAADTARLFVECLSFDARLQLAEEAIGLAEATVSMATKRVRAGRSPAADQVRAEADLARAELLYEDLQHTLLVAMHRLAAQWGEISPEFSTISGDLTQLPDPDSYESLVAQIRNTPDQQYFYNEQRLRETEIRLARSNAKPNWRVSLGLRRFESSDDHALVTEFSIPIALRNKNQGRIAAAQSELILSRSRQSQALLRSTTELFAIYQEMQHSLHVANAFNARILPKAKLALKETQRAYAAGRYSFYELSTARAELLAARAGSVEAAVDFLKRVIEIERLTGVSLSSSLTRTGDGS